MDRAKSPRLTWRAERRTATEVATSSPVSRTLWLRREGYDPEEVATVQELRRGGRRIPDAQWFSYGGSEWGALWNTANAPTSQTDAEVFAESRVRLTHPAFRKDSK